MFDATQMPFYVKNNLILFKIDDQRNGSRWEIQVKIGISGNAFLNDLTLTSCGHLPLPPKETKLGRS